MIGLATTAHPFAAACLNTVAGRSGEDELERIAKHENAALSLVGLPRSSCHHAFLLLEPARVHLPLYAPRPPSFVRSDGGRVADALKLFI